MRTTSNATQSHPQNSQAVSEATDIYLTKYKINLHLSGSNLHLSGSNLHLLQTVLSSF